MEPDAETSCVALATNRLDRIELSTMLTELTHPYTEVTQMVETRYGETWVRVLNTGQGYREGIK